MTTLSQALATAIEHHRAGRFGQAERIYRSILQANPQHPDALHLLGLIAHEAGREDMALEYIRQAIAVRPDVASFHGSLGLAYQALGQHEQAVRAFQEALRLKPDYAEAHNNLGAVWKSQGQLDRAEAEFGEAIRHSPDFAEAHWNLARLLEEKGKPEEAAMHRRRALPQAAVAHRERGDALLRAGRLAEAVEAYRQAIAAAPTYVNAHNDLGNALQRVGKLDEAIACYFRALQIEPSHAPAHSNLGVYFKDQGKLEEAARHFKAAVAVQPSDTLRVLLATLLPPVYMSQEEVEERRRGLLENLARLEQDGIKLDPSREVVPNLFYLAYQGFNDRDIQRDFAALYVPNMPPAPELRGNCAGRKIRLGLISKYFKDHTIGLLMRGLVAKISRERFEVTTLTFAPPRDPVAQAICGGADRYVVLADHVPTARQTILDLNLDILFHADIGMDPTTFSLAFSRLAPVQCVTWGHPLTTGIPVIDFFVSSELIEPEGAEGHYTEKLMKLKTLPFYYYRPAPPAPLKEREHFGLPADAHVYACLQTLFKFHPQFDEALGGILRRDPQGLLVMLQGKHQHWEEMLRQRWATTLPDVVDRIRFLPPQKREDFLNLTAVSDVLLDTYPFSGGNTSYEGLALGVPIVTLAAPFMRGRITYALYKKMEMMDCVAATPAEYIDRAIELGTDAEHRRAVAEKIATASGVLFEDMEAVRELEEFFVEAVANAR
jgi:predicted O-linked N-acetylglucosamine transferase (SPINDLY family)